VAGQTRTDPLAIESAAHAEPVPRQVRAPKLGAAVVHRLVNDIVRGVYPPGSCLPTENELRDQFAVSRTLIRESVKIVQEKGLINIEHGRRTQVTDPRMWNLLDDAVLTAVVAHDANTSFLDELVATRAALEAGMAASAAGTHSADDDRQISAALEQMRCHVGRAGEFAAADVHFHDMVMAASGNRLARAIVNRIHQKARASMRYHGDYSDAVMEQTVVEHEAVQEAILASDPTTAGAAMRAHIQGSWQRRRPGTPGGVPTVAASHPVVR